MQSDHLAEPLPHTGYEPKSCIDVSSEHTPINYPSMRNSFNIENDLTTTFAASENSDVFHQQAAASGSLQPVPASVVNPWLSADIYQRGNEPTRSTGSLCTELNMSKNHPHGTTKRVKPKAEFVKHARKNRSSPLFASSTDLCHLTNAKLAKLFQKNG